MDGAHANSKVMVALSDARVRISGSSAGRGHAPRPTPQGPRKRRLWPWLTNDMTGEPPQFANHWGCLLSTYRHLVPSTFPSRSGTAQGALRRHAGTSSSIPQRRGFSGQHGGSAAAACEPSRYLPSCVNAPYDARSQHKTLGRGMGEVPKSFPLPNPGQPAISGISLKKPNPGRGPDRVPRASPGRPASQARQAYSAGWSSTGRFRPPDGPARCESGYRAWRRRPRGGARRSWR